MIVLEEYNLLSCLQPYPTPKHIYTRREGRVCVWRGTYSLQVLGRAHIKIEMALSVGMQLKTIEYTRGEE